MAQFCRGVGTLALELSVIVAMPWLFNDLVSLLLALNSAKDNSRRKFKVFVSNKGQVTALIRLPLRA